MIVIFSRSPKKDGLSARCHAAGDSTSRWAAVASQFGPSLTAITAHSASPKSRSAPHRARNID
jgi:hypothetical protein